MTTTDYPREERYVYIATFKHSEPLSFRNENLELARDHADYVARVDYHDTVVKVRRATPEEIEAHEADWAARRAAPQPNWTRVIDVDAFRSLGTNPDGTTELVTTNGDKITFTPRAAQELVEHLMRAATVRLVPVLDPSYPMGWSSLLRFKNQ